jgi:hypothetical protein
MFLLPLDNIYVHNPSFGAEKLAAHGLKKLDAKDIEKFAIALFVCPFSV